MTQSVPLRLHSMGEAALVCELPAPATLEQQQRIWALAAEAMRWRGVREALPGMNNLSLLFDPDQIDGAELEMQVLSAWPQLNAASIEGRSIEIPVKYGGEFGPDLADVASHTGLTPSEVVRRHSEGDYVVYLLGFLPGFAFMGGLASELATPRRTAPRLEVPAGAIGIGGEQTGIYPMVSPGGWQLIGRTPLKLFDPTAAEPTLLRPGDHVRFVVESLET